MADTYNISAGSGRVQLSGIEPRNLNIGELGIIAIQVVSDASLDANVTIKLQQSIKGTDWNERINARKRKDKAVEKVNGQGGIVCG